MTCGIRPPPDGAPVDGRALAGRVELHVDAGAVHAARVGIRVVDAGFREVGTI